jgi:glycosyltransferase involved in cell wall biosynthesis
LSDSQGKLDSKDEELRLADTIFVASRFTAKTLEDFQGKLAPVKVIPYGFPSVTSEKISAGFNGQRPLKVLFVGGLSQRKGIAYLFEAVSQLGKRVELTIVGSKASEVVCEPLNKALSQHKWIPSLANSEILKLMKSQDVLVFPSLFEGFGLVITEAMSQGTPVITTDRTAGPDLISNGENGWLIEAGSTEAIRTALEEILTNPESILKASIAARETARKRTWEAYGLELAEAIKTS